ncbi:MAG: Maf family protein [Firmicutes bacterium]|nr:Maf family protein [Bacillota bacterium]
MNLQERFNNGEIIKFPEPTLILASASRYRGQIMEQAGYKITKIISTVDDTEINHDHPHENVNSRQETQYAKQMALAKLQPFIGKIKNGAVITVDSSAFCHGRILEKPLTKEKCREQHEFLSGKTNYAYVGYAVYYNGKILTKVKKSKVKIKNLPEEIIQTICNEDHTLNCAGYRTSGAIGPYVIIKPTHKNNVIGIDPKLVTKMLRKIGFTAQ